MGRLVEQVQALARGYTRKGGKINRRQQAARMTAFALFCETSGAEDLGQVGKRHVERYWLANGHLAAKTLYNHYRALIMLWRLAGKNGLPPKPNAPNTEMPVQQPRSTAKPDGDVDVLPAVSREAP